MDQLVKEESSKSVDRIFVSEIPEEYPTFYYISEKLGLPNAIQQVEAQKPTPTAFLQFALSPNVFSGLRDGAFRAIEKYGLHGWLTNRGRSTQHSYKSLSLTYNPHHQEQELAANPHVATLGTGRNPEKKTYYGSIEHHTHLKHSYYDTYGFRFRTPATFEPGLDAFFQGFRRSLIRSRISALDPVAADAESFEFNWHRDESVFENLRLLIPLQTHESFRLQIEWGGYDKPQAPTPTMETVHLPAGFAYTFDTHRPHRAFRQGSTDVLRIHMIIGISPWLDYDSQTDSWVPNEFYGRKHPFEMLADGDVHPLIRASN